MASKITRALVLSGGGGRGAYECGVYKFLERAEFVPDILVGASIKAINAALRRRCPSLVDGGSWYTSRRGSQ